MGRIQVFLIGFPLSPELVYRELIISQGTIDCALYALQFGCALNIAGGTHHAFAERGEGFCLLNDQAIAANYLISQELVRKILIIDLDVHQGNGTAKLMENEPRVFTFSMHGLSNYPFHKETSDLDIPLPDGINGEANDNKIPVAIAMGGGYSPDIKTIVEAHCNTFRIAMDIFD